jgi:hypothetical protein
MPVVQRKKEPTRDRFLPPKERGTLCENRRVGTPRGPVSAYERFVTEAMINNVYIMPLMDGHAGEMRALQTKH